MNTETNAKTTNKEFEIFRGTVGTKHIPTFTLQDVVDTCREMILSDSLSPHHKDIKNDCTKDGIEEMSPDRVRKLKRGDIVLTMVAPILVENPSGLIREFSKNETDYTPEILIEDTAFLIGYLLSVSKMRKDIKYDYFMEESQIENIIDSTVSFLDEIFRRDIREKQRELM